MIFFPYNCRGNIFLLNLTYTKEGFSICNDWTMSRYISKNWTLNYVSLVWKYHSIWYGRLFQFSWIFKYSYERFIYYIVLHIVNTQHRSVVIWFSWLVLKWRKFLMLSVVLWVKLYNKLKITTKIIILFQI